MGSNNNVKKDSANLNEATSANEFEENFEALLEKPGSLPVRLIPGQKVTSRVISISVDSVYIDFPGKTEGRIDANEFKDDEGNIKIVVGDEVEAFFVSVRDGIRMMTTFIHGYPAKKLKVISDAHGAGVPVDGEVKRDVKGGFEISVCGIRCFCPFSQIDLKVDKSSKSYIGKTYPFMILEFRDEGRNIIVSRRVLLEQEKQARIERLQKTLQEDMEVAGTVTSIQRFGAFIDLGGVEGLLPVSEISWDRVNSPYKYLKLGQKVTVKIISIDWESERLSLSIKALTPDPWSSVAEKYPEGIRVNGTIVRLVPFGAFVNLESGVDGLIHISNFGTGRRINHPKEVVEVGQEVEAYVLSVDEENRKISLSMNPKPEPKKIVFPEEGALIEGVVEKIKPYGIFLRMNNGQNALIPNSEVGTPIGTDHKGMFPPGTVMKAVVIEVDRDANKVRLSRKAVLEQEAQTEYEEYRNSVRKSEELTGGFGRLGEILKAKLDEKKQES
jgi:small subunit ribosomal protein S1